MSLKKVVICSDSFKGTLSAIDACDAIESGMKMADSDIATVKLPMADGGEGTIEVLLKALGGERKTIQVTGPNFRRIYASYAILNNKTAVIEMAQASGLCLASQPRNPSKTTTYGTGELILDALNNGCRKFIVGIGGSATNDGGIGMASALGVSFFDKQGNQISLNGGGLKSLEKIDLSNIDTRLSECDIEVACDVDNPLYGLNGASYIYAAQKGADKSMIQELDDNLKSYADIIKRDLGIDVQEIKGAGAAGGLGAGLVAFANAKLKSGIEIILDATNIDNAIKDADLIITGEGRIDDQSLRGKVPIGILNRALKYNVPVIAIVGSIGDEIDSIYQAGIVSVFSINRQPLDFEVAKLHTKENLTRTAEALIRFSSIF